MISEEWSAWLEAGLARRRDLGLLRELRPLGTASSSSPVEATLDRRSLTLFCSNDYLGLSSHPRVRQAAAAAAQERGLGPRGSALVCGYTDLHRRLETELAELKGTEAALLFPTGYAANTATLAAIADGDTSIYSDALNHASIVDGCRMAKRSGAAVHVFRHADADHLASLLAADERPRRLVVTDTVFSMDGDLAPLPEIVQVAEEHGALVMVDEAHATLVLGDRGAGWAEACGVAGRVDLHVGTLSKAFGAHGGFVATSERLELWLLNHGRPYVFSTALPIPVVEAAHTALAVRGSEPGLVRRLDEHRRRLGEALGHELETPIASLVLGEEEKALSASRELLERGFFVPAIRPPTVPPGTSRLRVTLSAAHTAAAVTDLCEVLVGIRDRLRGPLRERNGTATG